jgi:chromosome segregation ATPase
MSGLLRHALHIRSRSPDETEEDDDLGVSEEERREISEQISAALRRQGPSLEEVNYTPKRRGVMLPLLVNLSAVLLVALTIAIIPRIMQPEAVSEDASETELRGAESLVIGNVRQEAAAELQAKQQEIASIESRLAVADQERAELAEQFDEAISAREEALRQELEAELAAARTRLEADGAGAAEIEAEIRALEAQREAELLSELQAERQAAQDELARRETELQAELARARDEQQALEAELQAELQAERAGMAEELASLEARDREEQAILAQVNGFYQDISDNIRAGQYASALSRLENLTQFLGRPSFDRLPRLAQRREADNVTAEALTLLLEDRLAAEADGTASRAGPGVDQEEFAALQNRLTEIQEELATARAAVAEAEAETAARDSQIAEVQGQASALRQELQSAEAELDAREGQLAEVQDELTSSRTASASRITALEDQLETTRADLADQRTATEQARADLNQARDELAAALRQVETNTLALQESRRNTAVLREELSRAEDALAELRARRASVTDAISNIGRRAAQETARTTGNDQAQVISMLTTKLQVQQLLSSESMRAVYPDLHERMDTYLSALEAESRAEGRATALADLSDITAAVRSPNLPPDAFDYLWASYASDDQRQNLLQFLENLRAVVEG